MHSNIICLELWANFGPNILCRPLTLSCSANERTEMKLKIYLSEAWMCSEFGMLITDVERERVKLWATVDNSNIQDLTKKKFQFHRLYKLSLKSKNISQILIILVKL